MMELGITQSTNIHKTRLLIRTLKYVLDILQRDEAITVEEYKHTHTHTECQFWGMLPRFLSDMLLQISANTSRRILGADFNISTFI